MNARPPWHNCCPGCSRRSAPFPPSGSSRSRRRRCPAAAISRWNSSWPPRRSRPRCLQFARQLQLKAMGSGMFAFPPIIDVKIDQPQSEIVIDREMVADLGLDLQQVGSDIGSMVGGNYVNRFSIAGRSYKVVPQISRTDRLNPDQLRSIYVTGPDNQLVPLSTIATIRNSTVAAIPEPLPAAQRRHHQRRGRAAPGRGPALPGGRSRQNSAQRLRPGLHGRIAPAAHRGQLPSSRPSGWRWC